MGKKSKTGTTANPEPAPAAPAAAVEAEPTALPGADDAALVSKEALEGALKDALEGMTGPASKPGAEPEAQEPEDDAPEARSEAEDEPEEDTAAAESDEETDATEESPEDEPAPEPDEDAAKKKPWPKSYLKRITKLTDRIAQLEEKLAEQGQPPEPEPGAAAPLSIGPAETTAASPEEKQLRDAITQREEFVRTLGGYLKRIEDGETPTDPQGKPVQWSAEQMEDARQRFGEELTDLKVDLRVLRAEARRTQAQAATQLAQALAARHPWTQDRTNPDTQTIERVLQRYPILKQIPEARTWLADGLSFQRLLERVAKRNGAAPAKRTVPTRAPTSPAAAPRAVNSREAEMAGRTKRFLETGSTDDARALMEQLL